VIYRKSDVKNMGWEVLLSHEMRTGITTGFCKGTASSGLGRCLEYLKGCILQIGHPILFPIIIFSHYSSFNHDIKQRNARDWLQRLESVIAMHRGIAEVEGSIRGGAVDLDAVNRDLVKCHVMVLGKRPVAYLQILESIKEATELFIESLPGDRKDPDIKRFQASITSRLEFYKKRLRGVETYANTTLQRLDIQKNLVSIHYTLGFVEC
jgi:hypothetical protein